MKNKKLLLVWSISLLVIAGLTLVTSITNIIGISLPDTAVRIIGILDLIALPVLAFTTVRMFIEKKETAEK
ncbi:MAG: hypothetical protein IKT67_05435 [Lachnospiraceae bacterium]|nr:hypothetical protein [Lachnospiraceae bacterium]